MVNRVIKGNDFPKSSQDVNTDIDKWEEVGPCQGVRKD